MALPAKYKKMAEKAKKDGNMGSLFIRRNTINGKDYFRLAPLREEIGISRIVGKHFINGVGHTCPAVTFGRPCTACNAEKDLTAKAAKLGESPKNQKTVERIEKLIDDIKVRRSYWMIGLLRSDPSTVGIFDAPYSLQEAAVTAIEDDEKLIDDPVNGYDFRITKKGAGLKTKYDVRREDDPSPLADSKEERAAIVAAAGRIDLERFLQLDPKALRDDVESVVGDLIDVRSGPPEDDDDGEADEEDEDEGEEEDEAPAPKKGKKAPEPEEDEDEGEDEDEEEEPEPAPKKKKAKAAPEPEEDEEDEGEDEDEEEEDEDEGEEEDGDIDEEPEEEDEAPAPKKGKKANADLEWPEGFSEGCRMKLKEPEEDERFNGVLIARGLDRNEDKKLVVVFTIESEGADGDRFDEEPGNLKILKKKAASESEEAPPPAARKAKKKPEPEPEEDEGEEEDEAPAPKKKSGRAALQEELAKGKKKKAKAPEPEEDEGEDEDAPPPPKKKFAARRK